MIGDFVGLLEARGFRTIPRSHHVSKRHDGRGSFNVGVALGGRCVAVGEIVAYTTNADRQPLLEQLRGVSGSQPLDLE